MSTVVLESVSRTYGSFSAVKSVSFTARQGEFVTLLGPSGCGKTTTLRMIAGLERNSGGRISIADRLVSDAERGLFVPPERRQLGMVFQSYAIWPHMTVFDNVAYPLTIRRKPKAEIGERVRAALRMVEMEAFADRPAPALSGGQQQRVAIARALVAEPGVLLLDEPLSNLDARLRTQMGDEFRSLQKRLGITTLYVTHDQDEAMALSDRVVVMQAGSMLQVDTPEAIYNRPASVAVATFLGAPNIVPARATGSNAAAGGEFTLSADGDGWSGKTLSATDHAPGSRIAIMLRPTSFRIGQSDGADLTLSGVVEDVVFRGATRTMNLRTPAGTLALEVPSASAPRSGDNVTAHIPAGEAWALPAG